MLPPFNEAGDLPPGIHPARLSEVVERFGGSRAKRQAMTRRLERIFNLAAGTGLLHSFVVFGSYVSDKDAPNDVDVFLVMADAFDVMCVTGEVRLLFDHSRADSHFGASVFWMRELAAMGATELTMDHWQIKRDGSRRGIVRIIPEEVP